MRNDGLFQACAARKGEAADLSNTCGEIDPGQTGAVEECAAADFGSSTGESNRGQGSAFLKGIFTDGNLAGDGHGFQCGAEIEGTETNGSNRGRDGDAFQAGAAPEGTLLDCLDAAGDRNGGEAFAFEESVLTDGSNGGGNGDGGHVGAAKEGIATDGGNTLLNDHGPDLLPDIDPWKLAGSGPVQHLAGTGDGQHTVVRQSPDQPVAAAARGEDRNRKGGKKQA